MTGKWASITLLCLCQVAALAVWFAAAAAAPAMQAAFAIPNERISLLTSLVQLGFVAGTLTSASFGLADRIEPRRLFMFSALAAAGFNALLIVVDPASVPAAVSRFATGVCMAGIYPVGMKMAAGWAQKDLGLLIGLLVGALTLGSASPHLFAAFADLDWRLTIGISSVLAGISGILVNRVRLGPNVQTARHFHVSQALDAWRQRPLRYANLGYLGHMWELYAMWAWIGLFLHASFNVTFGDAETASTAAKLMTFATVAAGAVGCLLGGIVADRLGRTTLTIGAMAISGSCAVLVGFLFGGSPVLLGLVCVVWGITIVADSAQFSASIAELADRSLIGTMLTVQTCAGFLLTLVTIHAIPVLVEALSWTYAFAVLALGPLVGVWFMGSLRGLPEAERLAGGRR